MNDERNRIIHLVGGQMAGQVVAAAARLGVADLIGDDVRTGPELADRLGADPAALTRLLRALAALGLLTEVDAGTFRLTGAGALLRTDRPDSLTEHVLMFSDPTMLAAWQRLDDAVRTGATTFEAVFGVSFFEHLSGNPRLSARFNASMRQSTLATAAVLPTSYDFVRFHTVLDIGGGNGALLAAVLARHPALRGVLYDTAPGLSEADATLAEAGVADRCATRTGNFFTSIPPDADLYMLKSVLHNWDDERAHTILEHCRKVIPHHGRLLIIERVLPGQVTGSGQSGMYLADLNMLVNVGGRERTHVEFEQLCTRAGFNVIDVRALPAPSWFSMIEAAPTH